MRAENGTRLAQATGAAPEVITSPLGLSATTREIADLVDGELVGPGDLRLIGFGTLADAEQGALTFIRNERYASMWSQSVASAALVARGVDVPGHDPKTRALIIVDDPDLAMITLVERAKAHATCEKLHGVHPTAVVDPLAQIHPDAWVGPNCVVEAHTIICEDAKLHAGVHVGASVVIGAGTTLMPGVFIGERCRIGPGCLLHANVNIGADGFGFRPDPSGVGLVKVPHLGAVVIGKDVEIGAGACVDRGSLSNTTIADGAKIDNLVQIAHNCRIGRSCIICGHSALSGSVTLGDGVRLGGRVSIADNITIGAGATVGASSNVMNDIPAGETWLGTPAGPAGEMARNYAAFRKLWQMARDIKRLKQGRE